MSEIKILLVEDDQEIARIISDHLTRQGYTVTWASTGLEGWEDFQYDDYFLIIVDLMLPEMDGFTLCKNIRLASEVPIIITSARQEDEAKVKGLNLGADDYLTKPFSLVELTARIKSQIRRYERYTNKKIKSTTTYYKHGLAIDFKTKRVWLDQEEVLLTQKEKALLSLFVKHPQQVFSKQELYEHVWQQTDELGNNTVTVHVKGLRTKLKENSKDPKFIQTIWGTGYRFIGEQIV
ncbi:MAG TPA: response regulator transcription factor [Massilibacterium sp.]|nr:response regulator transcription factor [Massilibacterium sp.]